MSRFDPPIIPPRAGCVDGWQDIPLVPSSEPLVAIGRGTVYDDLLTSSVYAGEHLHSPYRGDTVIDAAVPIIYVRQSVAERLRQAQSMLPTGMSFIVFDGYRSVEVQQALFEQFLEALRILKPDWSEDALIEETEHYVALPSTDVAHPSPHSTGGAVDIAIVRDNTMIEFGTPFDHGSERSALRYFEDDSHVRTSLDHEARQHRRLLYDVMQRVGMQAYEYEWWHYNAPETQMGVSGAHLDASACLGAARELIPKITSVESKKVIPDSPEPFAPIDRIAPSEHTH